MSGNFYEVFENGRRRAQLTPQEELDFFAPCLEIRMFNVGEGEVVLLVFPNDHVWLVDGGSSTGTTINDMPRKKKYGHEEVLLAIFPNCLAG